MPHRKNRSTIQLILTILLLLTLSACTATAGGADGSGNGNGKTAGKNMDVTPRAAETESDEYYENMYKYLRLTDETGQQMYTFDFYVYGDSVALHQFTLGKAGTGTLRYFGYDGTLQKQMKYPEEADANYNTLTASGHIAAVEKTDNRETIVLYDLDDNVIGQSLSFPALHDGYAHSLHSFGEEFFVYHSGYEAVIVNGFANEPVTVELPCYVTNLSLLPDGTFLLYGSELVVGDNRYYTMDPVTGECASYRYSDTVSEPRALFETNGIKVWETYYQDGEFYAVGRDGLYVYRDGAPLLLVNWAESALDGEYLELQAVLSDDAFLITYRNFMNEIYDFGLLIRTEERRTKPREVVRLAAVGLDSVHRDLISAAALQFNRENDDYRIDLTVYETQAEETLSNTWKNKEEKHAAIGEAAQNAFEADLLAGVTYDGYFLPEVSEKRDLLSDKGLLCDLSAYIGEDQLLGCIETAYTTDDGIIALPFFMKLSTLVTTQDILPSKTSLTRDVLYDIAAAVGDGEALFSTDVYSALKTVGQYDFIDFDTKTCSFDTEDFAQWMDFLLDVRAGTYTDESLEVIHEIRYESDFTASQEFALTSLDKIAGNTLTAPDSVKFTSCNLNSVESISAMLLNFKGRRINYCGYPSDDGTTVLLSSDAMFSMSKTAPSPDGAAAFMQYLLSDGIQTCRRVEQFGLPVSRTAMESVFPVGYIYYRVGIKGRVVSEGSWYADHPDALTLGYIYSETSANYDGVFTSVYTREDDRDLFIRFLDRATVKTAADATLATILDEEISYAEAGVRDAKETGRILQSRVNIYINE
ncbi:MAG: hypothetical protein IJ449_05620 [Clostridia bacterium]|nr:hypothetical protein [Clostridia bacterium]